MNKKIIGIIVAIVIVLLVVGLVVFIKNDSLNTNKDNNGNSGNNDSNKVLGTTITNDNDKDNVKDEEKEENEKQDEEKIENSNNSDKKILIAYFSRADENYNVGTVDVGNTEIMAGYIKDYLGDKADTFKIDPVNPYPVSYKECTEVATKELRENARPEFKNPDSLNIDNYDTIFIGYPIWWGDVPMIINTFLESYDFSGKTIIPFNTHEGSGISGTYASIKSKMSSSEVNTNGLAITGQKAREESSRSTVENWLKELGY